MCPNQMNKEYLKPVIRLLSMKTNRLLEGSPIIVAVTPGEGNYDPGTVEPLDDVLHSRFGFWDDIDDNLLEDIEDINDYD